MHSPIFFNLTIGLLLAITTPSHSMENSLSPVQNQALQIVMLNCLQRNDFKGVTHIMEKTRLIPGKAFIESLPKGILLLKQLVEKEPKNIDWSYQLFKASIHEKHKLIEQFLCSLKLLPHVDICASFANDYHIQRIVNQNPQFPSQNKIYKAKTAAFNLNVNKQAKNHIDVNL